MAPTLRHLASRCVRRLIVAGAIRDHAGVRGDAVLVAGHRIVEVGRSGDLRSADLPEERFPGTTIIPGLRDAHLHPVGLAAALLRLSLKEATDLTPSPTCCGTPHEPSPGRCVDRAPSR